MKKIIFLFFLLFTGYVYAGNPPAAIFDHAPEVTTSAAVAYCLAKHPYSSNNQNTYTDDGYEKVSTPGIVGAVRRNFIYDRTTDTQDEGSGNSCTKACNQFGKVYNSNNGAPLHQIVANGNIVTSGIGDMGVLAVKDKDFYLNKKSVIGVWSRGNTWHENDVAQADFCCCQVK